MACSRQCPAEIFSLISIVTTALGQGPLVNTHVKGKYPFSPLPDFRYATLTTAAASTAQNSSLSLLNWDYCSARVPLLALREKSALHWKKQDLYVIVVEHTSCAASSLKDHIGVVPITQCLKRFASNILSSIWVLPIGKIRFLYSHGWKQVFGTHWTRIEI